MRRILHIISRPDRELVDRVIEFHKSQAGIEIEVVDLARTDVNYDALLDQIFAADSVQVW